MSDPTVAAETCVALGATEHQFKSFPGRDIALGALTVTRVEAWDVARAFGANCSARDTNGGFVGTPRRAHWTMRRFVGGAGGGSPASGAIGHVRPLMPGRVVGEQLPGGRGRTEELLW